MFFSDKNKEKVFAFLSTIGGVALGLALVRGLPLEMRFFVGPDIWFLACISFGFFVAYFSNESLENKLVRYIQALLGIAGIYGFLITVLPILYPKIMSVSFLSAGGYLCYTKFDVMVKLFIILFYCWILLLCLWEVLKGVRIQIELPFFLSLLFFCFITSIHCANFFLLFLFMELITVLLIVCLVSFLSLVNAQAVRAVLEFFVLNIFISAFYLFGTGLFLYFAVPQSFFKLSYFNLFITLDFFINSGQAVMSAFSFIKLVAVFWLSLFGFKITIAPFSVWLVRVYAQLPVFFLLVLMTIYKFVYLLLFLKVIIVALSVFKEIEIFANVLLLVLVIPSLFMGCLAYRETDLRTVFSYTTVMQLGIVLSGCLVQDSQAIQAALIYFMFYCLQMAAVFTILLLVQVRHSITNSLHLCLVRHDNLLYAGGLTILFFSFAGVPPFSGFFLKYFLLLHIYNAGLFSLALAGLVTSFLTAIIYFHLIVQLLWEPSFAYDYLLVEFSKPGLAVLKRPDVYDMSRTVLHGLIVGVLIFTVGFFFIYDTALMAEIGKSLIVRVWFFA